MNIESDPVWYGPESQGGGHSKLQSVIDAMTDEIAILDSSGRIAIVNSAWKTFCLKNGGDQLFYIGENYLRICRDAASDPGMGVNAIELEKGLREIIKGTKQEFSMEYPCHSLSRQKWFSLQATHLNHGSPGALVSHSNVTQRRRFQAALLRNEAVQTFLMNATTDSIVTTDRRGVIENVNHATELLFLYKENELLGMNVSKLVRPQVGRNRVRSISQLLSSDPCNTIRCDLIGQRKDGTVIPVKLCVSSNISLDLRTFVFRDMSDFREVQIQALDVVATEKKTVGQELHDGIQQELTGLDLHLQLAQEILDAARQNEGSCRLKAEDFQTLRAIASKLQQGLRDTNRHVGKLARGIMPVQIEANGLCSALAELATNADPMGKCRLRFEGDSALVLPSNKMATNLYRIAQQAIHNSMMHSQADQIIIRLGKHDDEVVLEVTDNGIGFDHLDSFRVGTADRGIGLRIMDYRANSIGGELSIETSKSGGTTIRCTVSGECILKA
jgi:PAS domain S-box-containing protein